MPQTASAFVESNKDRLLSELKDFLRIPSVSTLPEHKGDVQRAAEFVADALRTQPASKNIEIIQTLIFILWCTPIGSTRPANPLSSATAITMCSRPNLSICGIRLPFEPVERDGNLYARGSADDKGQMYMHIKAVEALRAVTGTLPINLKFLIEGEEGDRRRQRRQIRRADRQNESRKTESRYRAGVRHRAFRGGHPDDLQRLARGLMYTEIEAHGPSHDLHSGLYGGVAPNAVFGLIELLSKMKDANGRILIPGVYQDVAPPSDAEKKSWASLPYDEQDYMTREIGSTALTGEKGYSTFEKTWSRPTLEVHGIAGGFTGAGAKTVIPATATAKVSMRLVPNMDRQRENALSRRSRNLWRRIRLRASPPRYVC